ncbi:MAG: hypothetical protein ABWZ88_13245 [Variovorax sp.]
MAFRADIAIPQQAAYQRWHNNEHIPERLSIPGFVRGRRYRSVSDDTRFLMYYDTSSLEVLTSDAYLAALNAPTPRTRTALRWFQNPVRTAYTLVEAIGVPEVAAAPAMAIASFALPAAPRARRQETLARLAAHGGVQRVLEYALDNAGSNITTGEAAVHGAAPSAVGGLLVVHSNDLALLDDPVAWSALDAATAQWAAANGIDPAPRLDFYTLEFALASDASPESPR